MELTSCEFFSEVSLREKCPHLEFFLSVFFCIRHEYGGILRILCIQSECRKTRTRKTPNTDNFYAVSLLHISDCHLLDHVKWIVHLSSIFDGPYFMKAFPKVYFWTVFNKFFIPAIYMMNTISCDFSPKVQF